MPADVSGVAYFVPIISFLLVFVIVFAVFNRIKLVGNSIFVQLLVSFLIAILFVSSGNQSVDYIKNVVPWFGILIVSLVLLLAIIGIFGKDLSFLTKGIGVIFVVLILVVFVVSAVKVFAPYLGSYFPGSSSYGNNADSDTLRFANWFYSSRVMGALLLLVIAGLVSWVLAKAK